MPNATPLTSAAGGLILVAKLRESFVGWVVRSTGGEGRSGGEREKAMPMAANDIERLIKARLPDANVTIRDLAGDGDHYAATVISETFRGKSRVQQHQIVYEALKGEMGGALHALALQTGVPES
jgi:stress-induced morphogen